MIGSGSGSIDGRAGSSEPLPRVGSGDVCMELLVVRISGPGDMMGDTCWGLDAIDELVTAEMGAVEIWPCGRSVVLT